MNIGVEIALIAALGTLGTKTVDLAIRKRVDKSESLARDDRMAKEVQDRAKEVQDREDRLKKEQLDREQISDLAIITHVPAWLEVDEKMTERELRKDLENEREKNRLLEAEKTALETKLASLPQS